MEKQYKLKSRGGENNYLKLMSKPDGSESKTYLLKTENPYIGTGYLNNGKFYVDPSGGPMLVEGEEVPDIGKIKDISLAYGYGYFITFE